MVEVFKTNINTKGAAAALIAKLKFAIPSASVHIDLEDCDKVLRVETMNYPIDEQTVVRLVIENNFYCEVLDY